MLTRRRFVQLSGMAAGAVPLGRIGQVAARPDVKLEIAPYTLEASPKHSLRTIAYNGQIPGPLLRMRQGQPQTVEVRNLTSDPEVVHWHGLHLPSGVDGAMEEGTPMIAPQATAQYLIEPDPAGFRWFHTHTLRATT
jgi:FtsP/CotA-like multicopper oxidase with cupredoxin domain